MEEEEKVQVFSEILKKLEDHGLVDEFLEFISKEKEKKDVNAHFGWLECI